MHGVDELVVCRCDIIEQQGRHINELNGVQEVHVGEINLESGMLLDFLKNSPCLLLIINNYYLYFILFIFFCHTHNTPSWE